MKQVVHRVSRSYKREGIYLTLLKMVRYIAYSAVDRVGKLGLYSNTYFRNILIIMNSRLRLYDARPDPFKIYWIDPNEIQFITGRGPNPGKFKWAQIGLIKDGEWDRSDQSFKAMPLYQGLKERYCQKKSWDECEFIEKVTSQLKDDRPNDWKRRFRSKKDLQRHCDKVDKLYSSILNEGYKKGTELFDPSQPDIKRYNEVTIDIGRDGEFLFVDGRHRLSIAKILELDEIPVRVAARHSQWQEVRERVAAAESPDEVSESIAEHLDHPDLQHVIKWNK